VNDFLEFSLMLFNTSARDKFPTVCCRNIPKHYTHTKIHFPHFVPVFLHVIQQKERGFLYRTLLLQKQLAYISRAKGSVQFQANSCGICGRLIGNGVGFPPSTSTFPC
jgi:hypothetical protein